MSKISLRAYTREIDSMIDQGQFDQAVTHCRYILSKFPKHIDTYRLLGKAYLEDNQNSNAADIFQRVLSAVPDDFVSHIGMSLIREEEGNLQSAITHMERAFEKQPYNNAIQEEIRRLYGKRDGLEPSKVRLTQGALARMYLKGGLVSQGIAELRSALAEQSERFDLRTLLAQAYQEADQVGKAIDTASVILKRFPFNLTANRILAQTLKTHDHPEEMAICRKRLYALSPYEAYVSEHAPTVEEVPDQAITIERMDSARVQEEFRTPTETDISWEAALGRETGEEIQEEEDVPEWLAGMGQEEIDSQEAHLEAAEPDQEFAEDIDAADESALPVDDLDQEESPPAAEEPEEEIVPDWLAGLPQEEPQDEQEPVQKEFAESPPPPQDIPQEEELPDEFPADLSFEDEPEQAQQDELEQTNDIPLDQEAAEDEEGQTIPEAPTSPPAADAAPQEQPPQHEPQASESEEDIPSWMEEAGWETSEHDPGEPEDIYKGDDLEDDEDLEPAEIPDWLQGKTPPDIDEEPLETRDEATQPEEQSEEQEYEPDWLAQEEPQSAKQPPGRPSVSEEQTSKEEREITDISPQDLDHDLEEGTEDFPDWLKDIKSDEEEQETTVAWLNHFTHEQEPEDEDIAAVEGEDFVEPDRPQQAPGDIQEPDWFKAQREESPPEAAELTSEESEDFLQAWSDEETSPAVEDVEDQEFETDPITEFEQGQGLTSDEAVQEDDFPDWLKELDSEDEPIEHELPTQEEQDVTPPAPSEPESAAPEEEMEEAYTPEEPPSLKEMEPEQEQADDLPAWLGELEGEPEPDYEAAVQEGLDDSVAPDAEIPADEEVEEDEAGPDWLDEIEEEEKFAPGPDAEDVEASPMTPEMEAEEAPSSDVEDEDATLAWLESLAEKQGADKDDFVTSAEDRDRAQAPYTETEDTGPAPDEQIDKETQPEEEELSRAEMPDWLADLEPDDEIPDTEESEQEFSPTASDMEDLDLDDKEALPGWLEEMDQEEEEVFGSREEDEIELSQQDISEPGGEITSAGEEEPAPVTDQAVPDWLGELADEESPQDADIPPSPTAESEATPAEEEDKLTFPDQESAVEDDDMAWLESLTADTDASEEGDEPPAEDISQAEKTPPDGEAGIQTDFDEDQRTAPEPQEEDLPSWLSDLEQEDVDHEQPDPLLSGEPEQETVTDEDESADWLEDIDQAEEEAPEVFTGEQEPEQEPSAAADKPPSAGMLKHLGEIEREKEQDDIQDEVPEWLADFKEEEDPQETAVLWLRRYVEGGTDVDLEKELKAYTDSLGSDEIPEWVEDLQEEDDPTSTAMLWLERLEKEEQFQRDEKQKRQDGDESDWLAELEKEDQEDEAVAAARKDADEFDVDEKGWLSDLEEERAEDGGESPTGAETETARDVDQEEEVDEEEEEVPPWMLATSPLEGDLLTGELMDDSEQEEIPDWLAGYQEEEPDVRPEEPEEDDDEYAWLSAYEDEERPAKRKIDLNQAPISQIETLLGVNYHLAESIVTYREQHGPFESHEDLKNVPELDDERTLDILRAETVIVIPEKTPEESQPAETESVPQIPAEEPPQPAEPALNELQKAKNKLDAGDIDSALEIYENMIDEKENIEQVIDDLSDASYDHPMDVSIIKTLGDAYMSIDKLQEALDAYSKAEDLLR